LNEGFGFIWGNSWGNFSTWVNVYSMNPLPDGFSKDRMLGAQALLWGETSNDETADTYMWVRASALAERLWNMEKDTIGGVAERLI